MPGFNFAIDPDTRDYKLDARGQRVLDETAQTPLQLALGEERGKFWGAPSLGADIAALMRGEPPPDAPAAIVSAVERALDRLIALGRIVSRTVTVVSEQPLTVRVEAIDGGSRQPVALTLNLVG